MLIRTPNNLIEVYERLRCRSARPTPSNEGFVRYTNQRWYRLDTQRRVVRVAMTYFEVMQPLPPCGLAPPGRRPT